MPDHMFYTSYRLYNTNNNNPNIVFISLILQDIESELYIINYQDYPYYERQVKLLSVALNYVKS